MGQAETEQRNAQWLQSETQKAFGGRLRELARLEIELTKWKSAHAASKPSLPTFDRSDLLGAMETIAVAQRVAATKPLEYHTVTPAERLAALRVPTLAKLPESIAQRWTDEAIAAANPDRMSTFAEDMEAINEAEQAITIVKHSLQAEAGHIDQSTGVASHSWGGFEREHLGPIRKELEEARAAQVKARAADAVAEAKEALRKAEAEQHDQEVEALRKML